jgi:CDP-diacylglycerol--serine O-phosphatidyltransferase
MGSPVRTKQRQRVKLDLRKTMFVLPNLFTLSSIFCGFYAIVLSSGDAGAAQMRTACVLIAFALFFDAIDGRVARLTRTQSEFGMELDSLADVVSFGAAPALLAYRYGLAQLGTLGIFVAFAFAACGAIRLARFNVIAHREEGVMQFFLGLPIPLAAGVLVSVILASGAQPLPPQQAVSWCVLMLVVSYLMVSNIRYRTFKKIGSRRVAFALALSVVSGFGLISRLYSPEMALATLFFSYVGLGLLEEVIFFRTRRRAEVKTAPLDAEEIPPTFDEEDEEVEQEAKV